MDDPEIEPEPEELRCLLPDGCKNLVDALHCQPMDHSVQPHSHCFTLSKYPQGSPGQVSLPTTVTVSDLAEAIHLPVYQVIRVLRQLSIFVAPHDRLQFVAAEFLCSLCGVTATLSAR